MSKPIEVAGFTQEQRDNFIWEESQKGSTHQEIADTLVMKLSTVSAIIIRMRKKNAPPPAPEPVKDYSPAADLQEKMEQARAAVESAKMAYHELEVLAEQHAIKCVWVSETSFLVQGVTERFVKLEGLAEIRKFIDKHYPQRG